MWHFVFFSFFTRNSYCRDNAVYRRFKQRRVPSQRHCATLSLQFPAMRLPSTHPNSPHRGNDFDAA
eukprot:m.124081 g.124081  ORF g.124081 m.124081 type:complete len:66 (+) comp37844_c1_seq25:299-496(+)